MEVQPLAGAGQGTCFGLVWHGRRQQYARTPPRPRRPRAPRPASRLRGDDARDARDNSFASAHSLRGFQRGRVQCDAQRQTGRPWHQGAEASPERHGLETRERGQDPLAEDRDARRRVREPRPVAVPEALRGVCPLAACGGVFFSRPGVLKSLSPSVWPRFYPPSYQYRMCPANETLDEACFSKTPLALAKPYKHTVIHPNPKQDYEVDARVVLDGGGAGWTIHPMGGPSAPLASALIPPGPPSASVSPGDWSAQSWVLSSPVCANRTWNACLTPRV